MTKHETITLQATGRPPMEFKGELVAQDEQSLDEAKRKRGIRTRLFAADGARWVIEVTYLTDWDHEREHRWVGTHGTLAEVSQWGVARAGAVLPPGAGYPATESFRARQERLQGLLRGVALDSLTKVLAVAAGYRG